MSLKKKNAHLVNVPIGTQLSFAASEAYKLLRTNLMFSIPGEKECKVIGVTSSVRGEGKSTTALNLAYALAEADKKVLLIEMDLRLPTIAKKLSINKSPGLSNLLVGLNKTGEVIQQPKLHSNLYIITSGDIPPNPSELISSERMKATVEVMSKSFDYIIMDLPPVNAVSDALAVSKMTDGMIMIVRQKYSNQRELKEAMRQLEIVEANILGFVFTNDETKDAAKYRKYKKYRKYGYGNGCGYDYTDVPERESKK